jgi:hypothetical protein
MKIVKSQGQTPTEALLSRLCDSTFLKLWCYANPFKSDKQELCDLLAVFENHVFIFFDRASEKFKYPQKDIDLQWSRWEKEVIQKQITTAKGAYQYILRCPEKIFLDKDATIHLPISIPKHNIRIHVIIVAHGAEDACKNFSEDNIYGSLAVTYSECLAKNATPFMIYLDNKSPIHVFDSCNLNIILNELDTFYDFSRYLDEKEEAIKQLDTLTYCGEEDLLAAYFKYGLSDEYSILNAEIKDKKGLVAVREGAWKYLIESPQYRLRKEDNKISYFWDDIVQEACQNGLDGSLSGNSDIFSCQNAIFEMAKEPRKFRRALSQHMIDAIENFPEDRMQLTKDTSCLLRKISFMPSSCPDKAYIFLQVYDPKITDYSEYRRSRLKILESACGATKNKFPNLKKIVGIVMSPHKCTDSNLKDFMWFDCEEWSNENSRYYAELNQLPKFFECEDSQWKVATINDFPKQ